MSNFWDFSAWGWILLLGVLLGSLLAGNILKKSIPLLRNSLIPTSVLGGSMLLIVAAIYKAFTGNVMFDTVVFNGRGTQNLELITYHALALGFIASAFKTTGAKLTKQRTSEIFNTGITTVSTYLLQAIVGFAITLICTLVVSGFFGAAGVLLPFGYGQGTGQALNYGTIYENDFGFVGGKSFGLTIAALGFLSAALGGVIHLNLMKKHGKLVVSHRSDGSLHTEQIQSDSEIPMQEKRYAKFLGFTVKDGAQMTGYTTNTGGTMESLTGCTIKDNDDQIDIPGNSNWIKEVVWLFGEYKKLGFSNVAFYVIYLCTLQQHKPKRCEC